MRWLYLDEYGVVFDLLPSEPDDSALVRIATLYALADKYHIVKLNNKICEELCRLVGTAAPPSMAFATVVYSNTLPYAPLRRLLVDWHVWYTLFRESYDLTLAALRGLPQLLDDFVVEYDFRVASDPEQQSWPLPPGGPIRYMDRRD